MTHAAAIDALDVALYLYLYLWRAHDFRSAVSGVDVAEVNTTSERASLVLVCVYCG